MSIPRKIQTVVTTARTVCGAGCVGVAALLLTACSTPPKPPVVDESTRRPVNARAAVDLQACQGDLSRATILVSELARAGVAAAALNKSLSMPAPSTANTAKVVDQPPAAAAGNLVAVVGFALGSAAWRVDAVDADALVRRAKGAASIVIRGRTDATGDSLQETALARRRAEAAAEFLRLAGVPAEKLRLTWQGAGDPVAGLRPSGRAQSRRVEIEFHASAPMFVSVRTGGLDSTRDLLGKGSSPAPDRALLDTAARL